jgi:hypothetical protein
MSLWDAWQAPASALLDQHITSDVPAVIMFRSRGVEPSTSTFKQSDEKARSSETAVRQTEVIAEASRSWNELLLA